LAAEHGVTPEEQRGYQFETGDRPAAFHAGESFLSAAVVGFAHASALTDLTNSAVVARSVAQTAGLMEVFVETHGTAHADEGGRMTADRRAANVEQDIKDAGVTDTVTPIDGSADANRFAIIQGAVVRSPSPPGPDFAGRKVDVYMFHNARSAERGILPAKIFFDFDLQIVRSVSENTLYETAAFLVANPALTVELIGRADRVGPEDYNYSLGLRRAREVEQQLLRRGVPSSQIGAVRSRGEWDARSLSRATHWQDRHVEIKVTTRS
jgi:outer membrane protein OmpA-like peptidoglycan-associated protein